MAESFSVGEIAIYVKPGSRIYGREVRIRGPLGIRRVISEDFTGDAATYPIDHPDGKPCGNKSGWLAQAQHLLKRKPPREDLTVVSWDTVPWWPEALVRNVKEPTHV